MFSQVFVCPRGEGVCLQRRFAFKRGLPRGGGVCLQGGLYPRGLEGGLKGGGQTPSGTTKTGDTHPTGKLSCLIWMSSIVSNSTKNVSHNIALVCVKGKTLAEQNFTKITAS